MSTLTIYGGYQVTLDESDYPRVAGIKWFRAAGKYACSYMTLWGEKTSIYMHRMIVGAIGRDQIVDHINGDTWDNRRENLRIVTKGQNNRNRHSINSSSGFMGVRKTAEGRWQAYINDGGFRHVGNFDTAIEAASARDCALDAAGDKYTSRNAMICRKGEWR